MCSSAFVRPTRARRERPAAWDWASPSFGTSSKCTAARSTPSSAGEGQGATFRVRLPLMIVHPDAAGDSRASIRGPSGASALTGLGDLHGIHVLAIDDEEDALTLLRVVLETAGAEVTTFNSPLAALERIAEVQATRPRRRSRHAGDGRVRADCADPTVDDPAIRDLPPPR